LQEKSARERLCRERQNHYQCLSHLIALLQVQSDGKTGWRGKALTKPQMNANERE
jgi:hypothetical protein